MPKRIVDGDALWQSKKLRKVRAEYRSHYAMLIPLATANGTFEADAERVWSFAYSFLFPDISVRKVESILSEFEREDLLVRWTGDKNKKFGYWLGIEKPGRLPNKSHQDRYLVATEDIPEWVQKRISGYTPDRVHLGLGIGIGIGLGGVMEEQKADTSHNLDKPVNVEKEVLILCRKVLGIAPEPLGAKRKDLKALAATYDQQRLLEAANDFFESIKGQPTRYPVSEFIRVADGLLSGAISVARPDPRFDELHAKLYETGNQVFGGKLKQTVLELLRAWTPEEILAAYQEHVSGLDDFQMKMVAKNFCDGATAILLARKKRVQDAADRETKMELARKQAQEQAAEETRRFEEQRAKEVELAKSEEEFFNA